MLMVGLGSVDERELSYIFFLSVSGIKFNAS